MLKKYAAALFTMAFFTMPALAFAQDEAPVPPDGLGEMISALIAAAQGGQWSIFASLIIMVLVFLATRIKFISDLIPKVARPWVAAIAGVLAAVAATAFTTGDWLQAILGGLVTGAAASGLWELVGKHVTGGKKEEEAPAEAPAEPKPAGDEEE